MTRNHIHCAVGLAGDKAVTSGQCSDSVHRLSPLTLFSTGMRASADLFIYLDVAALLAGSSFPLPVLDPC